MTFEESEALRTLYPERTYAVLDRSTFDTLNKRPGEDEPWACDNLGSVMVSMSESIPDLAHFYAGTFGRTVRRLRERGCKITYTAAAHDVNLSKAEHEKLGIPYNYPHLTEPELLERYLQGYKEADCLICPSKHSAAVMREFQCTNLIEVIPHGVDLPDRVAALPERFTVGYLGAVGPDKGIIYLLQAWKQLNYKDATLKIAGCDSTSPFVASLIYQFGGGNIHAAGWQYDISDFYNSLSLYVQPSVTEGFGIEVLEASAHSRAVVCSHGVGASDKVVPENCYDPQDVSKLAALIDTLKNDHDSLVYSGIKQRTIAETCTWDKVRQQYVNLWKSL